MTAFEIDYEWLLGEIKNSPKLNKVGSYKLIIEILRKRYIISKDELGNVLRGIRNIIGTIDPTTHKLLQNDNWFGGYRS